MDFKINRDSWHYRLNKYFFNEYECYMLAWEDRHADFCSYWRATFFRMMGIVISAGAGTLLVGGFGLVVLKEPVAVLAGLSLVGVIITLINGVDYISHGKKAVPPGLLKTKYLAWKGRYCPKVSYDE
jgi:hypothetical protein